MSKPTKMDIVNMAVTFLGEAPIDSLDDDDRVSKTMNLWYERAREYVLRRYHWTSAKKRATLAQSTETPAHSWDYYFALPSDFLRLILVDDGKTVYSLESTDTGQQLATDVTDPEIVYVRNLTSVKDMDPGLQNAIAAYLAKMTARRVTGNDEMVDQADAWWETAIMDTTPIDASQEPFDRFVADHWDDARRQGTAGEWFKDARR